MLWITGSTLKSKSHVTPKGDNTDSLTIVAWLYLMDIFTYIYETVLEYFVKLL